MNLDTETNILLTQLNLLKQKFLDMQKDLNYSIRVDIINADIKDIIKRSDNYDDLKNNLYTYLDKIMKEKMKENFNNTI